MPHFVSNNSPLGKRKWASQIHEEKCRHDWFYVRFLFFIVFDRSCWGLNNSFGKNRITYYPIRESEFYSFKQ